MYLKLNSKYSKMPLHNEKGDIYGFWRTCSIYLGIKYKKDYNYDWIEN